MSSGLLALLDDVALLVKASAANLDDISVQVSKTSSKITGIVIDDAAVTPKYVVGLDPKRELAIIFNIAKKSLFNKIIFLTPIALLLGYFMPWLITPILMLGGCYLCLEGYEKIHDLFSKHSQEQEEAEEISPEELEKIRTDSAIKTDLILSAEIIAVTYADVADKDFLTQIIIMLAVSLLITVSVYGFVGLIVKMDDIGLYFAKGDYANSIKKLGRGLVKAMPILLKILGYIGTFAMLWVGFEIVAHGIPFIHHSLEKMSGYFQNPLISWGTKTTMSIILGICLGFLVEKIIC